MYQPNFNITHNLLTYIASIEASKALIDSAPLVPSWEAKFRDEALTRTVHFGTKIEGNDLSEEQAKQVIHFNGDLKSEDFAEKTGVVARERDIQEVINYRNVLLWIDQQKALDRKPDFSLEILHTLHSLTMRGLIEEEEIGQFRKKQVIVRGVGDGKVVFRPPVSVEVPFLVEELFAWLGNPNNQIHPIFKAAIVHYQLVYIHPYVEGNGRTARAFATLVLYLLGYDFKRFFSLEQYFDSDVDQYYKALLSVQQSASTEMTFWMEYFCYGLAVEIDKVKHQVQKLSKDLKLKKELGAQVALSERQIILLELLQNQGKITSDDAQEVLPNISVDTILRDIRDLIKKGVVKKEGVTKGVNYSLV
ncbi:MAG: Fic family protein [Candidatus Pacebacteria bacterium]|nr:Fic family protein [Candidatus Paceibacterota bacterium]